MYERILRKIREKIRSHDYVMTTHADEEMWEDGLSIQDIENAILGGPDSSATERSIRRPMEVPGKR